MQHLNMDEFLNFYFYAHGEIIDLELQNYYLNFNKLKSSKTDNSVGFCI